MTVKQLEEKTPHQMMEWLKNNGWSKAAILDHLEEFGVKVDKTMKMIDIVERYRPEILAMFEEIYSY